VKDKLIGEEVIICGGVFKGHRGRVCKVDDKQAIVELSSQCRKIAIKRELVIELKNPADAYAGGRNQNEGQGGRSAYGNQSAYGGATVYDGGKTPGGMNTPSCHPQSAWGPNE
jgi:transcription elongation factor